MWKEQRIAFWQAEVLPDCGGDYEQSDYK